MTIISDLYNSYLPSSNGSTIQGGPRASDGTTVTEIGGDIDYGITDTGVSIITMTP